MVEKNFRECFQSRIAATHNPFKRSKCVCPENFPVKFASLSCQSVGENGKGVVSQARKQNNYVMRNIYCCILNLLTPSHPTVALPLSRERGAKRAKQARGESKNRNMTFYLSYYLKVLQHSFSILWRFRSPGRSIADGVDLHFFPSGFQLSGIWYIPGGVKIIPRGSNNIPCGMIVIL
jgi:hypothetical protein